MSEWMGARVWGVKWKKTAVLVCMFRKSTPSHKLYTQFVYWIYFTGVTNWFGFGFKCRFQHTRSDSVCVYLIFIVDFWPLDTERNRLLCKYFRWMDDCVLGKCGDYVYAYTQKSPTQSKQIEKIPINRSKLSHEKTHNWKPHLLFFRHRPKTKCNKVLLTFPVQCIVTINER